MWLANWGCVLVVLASVPMLLQPHLLHVVGSLEECVPLRIE